MNSGCVQATNPFIPWCWLIRERLASFREQLTSVQGTFGTIQGKFAIVQITFGVTQRTLVGFRRAKKDAEVETQTMKEVRCDPRLFIVATQDSSLLRPKTLHCSVCIKPPINPPMLRVNHAIKLAMKRLLEKETLKGSPTVLIIAPVSWGKLVPRGHAVGVLVVH
jgi:hypothetical protein